MKRLSVFFIFAVMGAVRAQDDKPREPPESKSAARAQRSKKAEALASSSTKSWAFSPVTELEWNTLMDEKNTANQTLQETTEALANMQQLEAACRMREEVLRSNLDAGELVVQSLREQATVDQDSLDAAQQAAVLLQADLDAATVLSEQAQASVQTISEELETLKSQVRPVQEHIDSLAPILDQARDLWSSFQASHAEDFGRAECAFAGGADDRDPSAPGTKPLQESLMSATDKIAAMKSAMDNALGPREAAD